MTRDEFSASYRLLKSLTDAGVRSYNALETASGDVVMVHLMDRGDSDTRFAIEELIRELPAEDRSIVITQGELDGHPFLVTRFLPGFTTLSGWLTSRAVQRRTAVMPVPAIPRPSPPAPTSGGTTTATFGLTMDPSPSNDASVVTPTPEPPPVIIPPAPPVVTSPAPAASTAPALSIVPPMPAVALPTMPAPPSSSAPGAFSPPTPKSVAPRPTTKAVQSSYQTVGDAAPKAAAPVLPPAAPPAPIIPTKSGAKGSPLRVDPTTGEPKAKLVPLLLALLLVTVVTVGVVMLVLAP